MAQAKKLQTMSATMQLWHSAIPIDIARFKFADPELEERVKELTKATFSSEYYKNIRDGAPSNFEFLGAMQETQKVWQAALDEKDTLTRQINQNFADMVLSSELRCFAFEFPRKVSSEPIEMQPKIWTVYPNWKTGEYKANGLHLIELRVLLQGDAESLITIPEPVAAGRPTIRDYVKAAFGALDQMGEIKVTSSATYHYPMIRQWIGENISDSKTIASELSNEGIRAHFSPLFKELKKNRKQ